MTEQLKIQAKQKEFEDINYKNKELIMKELIMKEYEYTPRCRIFPIHPDLKLLRGNIKLQFLYIYHTYVAYGAPQEVPIGGILRGKISRLYHKLYNDIYVDNTNFMIDYGVNNDDDCSRKIINRLELNQKIQHLSDEITKFINGQNDELLFICHENFNDTQKIITLLDKSLRNINSDLYHSFYRFRSTDDGIKILKQKRAPKNDNNTPKSNDAKVRDILGLNSQKNGNNNIIDLHESKTDDVTCHTNAI